MCQRKDHLRVSFVLVSEDRGLIGAEQQPGGELAVVLDSEA
jgi:hypothetical protein